MLSFNEYFNQEPIQESVKKDRISEMVENWEKEGKAYSNVSNDDTKFFDGIGLKAMEVGITSQTGNNIIYYNTDIYDGDTNAIKGKKK